MTAPTMATERVSRARSATTGRALALALLLCLASTAATATATAKAEAVGQRPLEELSLEELMRVEVTAVVGVEQQRFTSPAALYVITADEIRRSGHRTLFEALRVVPGMFVGRLTSSGGVAGPRGLVGNLITSNRMLVMVDGRVARRMKGSELPAIVVT